MLVETGFYDSSGNPCIHLHVGGGLNRSTKKLGYCFEAIIDTGFTGFMSVPSKECFALALPSNGITTSRLADGTYHEKGAVWACAMLAGKDIWGEAIVEPHTSEVLIGLEFLKAFHLALVLTNREVLLFNDDHEWPRELSEIWDPRSVREVRLPYRIRNWQ